MAINKDKIGLADQPLPNAERLLFGDDFPSIASKQEDLSRGLANYLGAASWPVKRPCSGLSGPPNKDKPLAGSYSKYNNHSKNGHSFRACLCFLRVARAIFVHASNIDDRQKIVAHALESPKYCSKPH